VIIVIIIGTAAATGATVYYSRNGSFPTTNLTSSSNINDSTSAQTSNASTAASQNGDYLIQISNVQPAPQGECGASQQLICYVFTVDATYTGGANWTVLQQDFELATASGGVVQMTGSLPEGDQPLSPATLLKGQHVAGQLEFALPAGQVPETLDYVDQSIGLSEEVPTPMTQPSASGQVAVAAQDLVASTLAAGSNSATPTCASGSAANSIFLMNTGDAPAAATAMSITYGGAVYTFPIMGACTVTATGDFAGNPLVITMAATDLVAGAVSGASFSGTVTMSNGVDLPFAGTFQ
jgi:hypothetical protein